MNLKSDDDRAATQSSDCEGRLEELLQRLRRNSDRNAHASNSLEQVEADLQGLAERVESIVQQPPPAMPAAASTSRYPITWPIWFMGVLANGAPAEAEMMAGVATGIDRRGITFRCDHRGGWHAKWVVGLQCDGGQVKYACVEPGKTLRDSIDGTFVEPCRDLFAPSNLIPSLNDDHRYQQGLPSEVLRQWATLQVLQAECLDRVLVCPKCAALPTMRAGCRQCGSARVPQQRWIHHLACGYQAEPSQFDREGSVDCPSCGQRRLIVGADFEYVQSPYVCQECGWTDDDRELVARCTACQTRFPVHQAQELELTTYHVDRLDPLAFLIAR